MAKPRRQTDPAPATIPLSIAAYRLHKSYNATLRLLLTGELKGERIGKRWMIDEHSLTSLAAGQGA